MINSSTAQLSLRDLPQELAVERRYTAYIELQLKEERRRRNMYLATVALSIGCVLIQTVFAAWLLYHANPNS
jgi:hypothetical protein